LIALKILASVAWIILTILIIDDRGGSLRGFPFGPFVLRHGWYG